MMDKETVKKPLNSQQEEKKQGKKRGNPDNLKGHGLHERTAEEQRRIAVMGGKASGETRRRKKEIREVCNVLLSMPANDALKGYLDKNIELPKDATVYDLMVARMTQEALKGNVKAFEAVRDSAGDKPTDKTEASVAVMTERDKAVLEQVERRLKAQQSTEGGQDFAD